jgi:hypothetical protein
MIRLRQGNENNVTITYHHQDQDDVVVERPHTITIIKDQDGTTMTTSSSAHHYTPLPSPGQTRARDVPLHLEVVYFYSFLLFIPLNVIVYRSCSPPQQQVQHKTA